MFQGRHLQGLGGFESGEPVVTTARYAFFDSWFNGEYEKEKKSMTDK